MAPRKRAAKSKRKGSYSGFKAVKRSAAKSGARNPAAVAAAAGRKKYGKKGFQSLAAKGRKKSTKNTHAARKSRAAKVRRSK